MKIHKFWHIGILTLALTLGKPQASDAMDLGGVRDQVNAGVVGVMCARADSAFTRLCEDLSLLLDKRYDLRVLGIMGKGSLTNIEDLLLLRGVDVAFAQADVIDFYEQTGSFPGIKNVVRYITTIHAEEMHVLARGDIGSIWDLEGKTVNFGKTGTGTFMTSSVVFNDLGIDVNATTLPHKKALAELRAGNIDAIVKVDGAPVGLFEDVTVDDGFRFLEVPQGQVSEVYKGSTLSSNDYPNIVPADQPIPTVAVTSVMAAYNWPEGHVRGQNVDRFVEAFFANFETLQQDTETYDAEWQEVDLATELPGWQRLRPAQKFLASR